MAFLNIFSKPGDTSLTRLPSGSFTMDQDGRIIASTLPQTFPAERAREIGELFIATFNGAHQANLPLSELVVQLAALKLTARPLRGGAIIFLSPCAGSARTPQPSP
ncbi:MAG: hypothetical protein ACYDH9_14405 [Limisphaerales bacterium]